MLLFTLNHWLQEQALLQLELLEEFVVAVVPRRLLLFAGLYWHPRAFELVLTAPFSVSNISKTSWQFALEPEEPAKVVVAALTPA